MYHQYTYGPPVQSPGPVPAYGRPMGSQRQSQIAWLQSVFGSHLREVSPGTVFDLPVQSQTANAVFSCTIRITLPPGFPETQAPAIQVVQAHPPVTHTWLESSGYAVHHPQIANWHPGHNCSQIVKEIATAVVEAAGCQPNIAMGRLPSNPTTPSVTTVAMGFVRPPTSSPKATPPPPPPPSNYPELDSMNAQQLEELMTDEVKFLDFCLALPSIKQLITLSTETKENVEAMAKANLAQEGVLTEARTRLIAQHRVLREAEQHYEALMAQLEAHAKRNQPQAIVDRMKVAAEEKEHETEEYANRFLEGEIDVKDFIKKFKEDRQVFHLRAAKAERLQERINSGR